jgi:hypothetical protein
MLSSVVSPMRIASPAPNPWLVGVICGMASYIDAAAIVPAALRLLSTSSPSESHPTKSV